MTMSTTVLNQAFEIVADYISEKFPQPHASLPEADKLIIIKEQATEIGAFLGLPSWYSPDPIHYFNLNSISSLFEQGVEQVSQATKDRKVCGWVGCCPWSLRIGNHPSRLTSSVMEYFKYRGESQDFVVLLSDYRFLYRLLLWQKLFFLIVDYELIAKESLYQAHQLDVIKILFDYFMQQLSKRIEDTSKGREQIFACKPEQITVLVAQIFSLMLLIYFGCGLAISLGHSLGIGGLSYQTMCSKTCLNSFCNVIYSDAGCGLGINLSGCILSSSVSAFICSMLSKKYLLAQSGLHKLRLEVPDITNRDSRKAYNIKEFAQLVVQKYFAPLPPEQKGVMSDLINTLFCCQHPEVITQQPSAIEMGAPSITMQPTVQPPLEIIGKIPAAEVEGEPTEITPLLSQQQTIEMTGSDLNSFRYNLSAYNRPTCNNIPTNNHPNCNNCKIWKDILENGIDRMKALEENQIGSFFDEQQNRYIIIQALRDFDTLSDLSFSFRLAAFKKLLVSQLRKHFNFPDSNSCAVCGFTLTPGIFNVIEIWNYRDNIFTVYREYEIFYVAFLKRLYFHMATENIDTFIEELRPKLLA